jgi:2-polyprenyl-6-methoxyphenol hydroxylase-like FAD-dependent oxidoreductase
MRNADIVVAGAGLAGSIAAAMLGRAGYSVVLVDPHETYPPDLRCEKLDGPQLEILRKTGLAEAALNAATHDGECWIARYGYLVEKRPGDQYGILYDTLVNTIRGEIGAGVDFIVSKVTAIETSDERQTVTLADGQTISARLVVLANGLNSGLRRALGMEREDIWPCHSITLGFDLKPVGRAHFDFPALTYYPESLDATMAYLSLFPIGPAMRANFMVYRDLRDPWLKAFSEAPEQTMLSVMPRLKALTGAFEVAGPVKMRPADLYVTTNVRQPGIVLVGDAFCTSCPAAGTGAGKVFNDVERLCNVHIPQWFASPGMDTQKIAAFYDDPVKTAYDAYCLDKAYTLRAVSTEPGLRWGLSRLMRFAARLGIGTLRGGKRLLSGRSHGRQPAAGSPGAGLRTPV